MKPLPTVLLALLSLCPPAFAERSFTEIESAAISRLELMHAEAEKKITANDFKGAVEIYQNLILLEPDDEIAYVNLGNVYMILGQFAKARESFEQALSINPESEPAFGG